ncbi:MAG: class I SAM-dependent methyltransferase [Planctomycetota bacterium]
MPTDPRHDVARFYDLLSTAPDDLAFYRGLITSPDARVLELGCGTGRVLAPLADHCAYIHGLDHSESMLTFCRQRLANRGTGPDRAQVDQADVADFNLGQTFDLVTAPYRVFQCLKDDRQVAGVMSCIREHLAPGGVGVLNVFHPKHERDAMIGSWARDGEELVHSHGNNGHVIRQYERRTRVDTDPLVIYPELVYRTYEHDELVDEVVHPLTMRCWYPEEFLDLIKAHGFTIRRTWGGYHDEPYAQGPELVVAFSA